MTHRRFCAGVAICAAVFLVQGCGGGGSSRSDSLRSERDALAIWAITGGDLEQVFRTMGYNVAVDRLWQLELYRRTATGRLAEIFGEDFLESDIFVRTISYSTEELETALDTLDPIPRSVIESYTAGINQRVGEVAVDPSLLPGEFTNLGISPLAWSTTEVLELMVHVLRGFDSEAFYTGQIDNAALLQQLTAVFEAEAPSMFEDLRWRNDPQALTVIPGSTFAAAGEEPEIPHPDKFPAMADAAREIRERMARIRGAQESINASVDFGSYSWAVAPSKTQSNRSFLYSGPALGFDAPSPLVEGSIDGGGLSVSGMAVPGIPGFLIGRTDNFAWGLQVGHAHTTDYYIEDEANVEMVRSETILVFGGDSVTLDIYRSERGPIVQPMPYQPVDPIISWRYAHWENELGAISALLELWQAKNVDEFSNALFNIPASFHVTYAGANGDIAYFMTGRDPVRAEGVDPRFPQLGDGTEEWPLPLELKPRPEARSSADGFFAGWNTKASPEAENSVNNIEQQFGQFRRGHVLDAYLSAQPTYSFEQLRDLALFAATTDSFSDGGIPWNFIGGYLINAVNADPTPERLAAIQMLAGWDGHFVAGGPLEWALGEMRADAWVLQDAWLREILKLTFEDEFELLGMSYEDRNLEILFNIILHRIDPMGLRSFYDWFRDRTDRGIPTDANGIFTLALDNALAELGDPPYDVERGVISFVHPIYGEIATSPFSNRSTWAQAVSMGAAGPVRTETLFALGQSGFIEEGEFDPIFDDNFFSQQPEFDNFEHTPVD